MEITPRGHAYTKRYGVEFPALIRVVIDAIMPLCKPLAEHHFGIGEEPSPRLISAHEARWLEGLAQSALEGALNQIAQLHRFDGLEEEMKAALRQRARAHGPLQAIFNQMRALQDKHLIAAAARAAARLNPPPPDKSAANALLAQWAIAAAREIERLDTLGRPAERARQKTIEWVLNTLEGDWRLAAEAFEDGEAPTETASPHPRAYFALSCATLACIYGRWALILPPLYDTLEALDAAHPEGQEVTAGSELAEAAEWLELAISAAIQLTDRLEPAGARDPLTPGTELGARPWTLTAPLGVEVWCAEDNRGQRVAVEEIWPRGDDIWAQQTQREALALSLIRDDHIAPCIDWGIDSASGRWYLSYPFIEGESLAARVERTGPLSEAQTRAYMLQVIEALKRALKEGIHHRQLQPESVIFYSDERVVLTRWGVHRAGIPGWRLSSDQSLRRRRFLAPERLDFATYDSKMEARADIYALGALIAFCLAPQLDARSPQSIAQLPVAYQGLIRRALDPNPEARQPDVGVIERELFTLKPLYNYRGEFGERDGLPLLKLVGLILSKPKALHSVWQPHLSEWRAWREVDEVAQLVEAALAQQAEERPPPAPPAPTESAPELRRAPRKAPSEPTLSATGRLAPPMPLQLFSAPEEPGTTRSVDIGGVQFKFCYVPQGDFLMGRRGSDPSVPRLERPQHVVSISRPLWVSQTPVTQAQYAALTGVNPSYTQGWRLPVEQVSWFDAARFCNLLSDLEGLPPAYVFEEPTPLPAIPEPQRGDISARATEGREGDLEPEAEVVSDQPKITEVVRALLAEEDPERVAQRRRERLMRREIEPVVRHQRVTFRLFAGGYRLLTEAEWEYAARAGSPSRYAGSDSWREVGWFAENSSDVPHPVGQKMLNAWSLQDMCGGVSEWCCDDARPYTRACVDPVELAEGEVRVVSRALRGGSWRRLSLLGQVTSRARAHADQRRRSIGFRVARPLLPVGPLSVFDLDPDPLPEGVPLPLQASVSHTEGASDDLTSTPSR
jgi:formylglycine-generating enzyme required for sulfatase activity/serine/threonine protein kinase